MTTKKITETPVTGKQVGEGGTSEFTQCSNLYLVSPSPRLCASGKEACGDKAPVTLSFLFPTVPQCACSRLVLPLILRLTNETAQLT